MLLCCCVVRRCWYLRCPAGEAGLFPARLADTAAHFSWPAFFLGFVFSRVFLLRAAVLLGCLGMTSRCDVMGVCEIPNHRMGMRHPKPQEKRHEAKGRMLTRASPTQSLVDLSYPAVLPLGSIRTEWVYIQARIVFCWRNPQVTAQYRS